MEVVYDSVKQSLSINSRYTSSCTLEDACTPVYSSTIHNSQVMESVLSAPLIDE
jgi:DNA mismatch repair ATPase MutL